MCVCVCVSVFCLYIIFICCYFLVFLAGFQHQLPSASASLSISFPLIGWFGQVGGGGLPFFPFVWEVLGWVK